jgi:hypothetical protein
MLVGFYALLGFRDSGKRISSVYEYGENAMVSVKAILASRPLQVSGKMIAGYSINTDIKAAELAASGATKSQWYVF